MKILKKFKTVAASDLGVFSVSKTPNEYLIIKPASLNIVLKTVDKASRTGEISLQSVRKELSATNLYTKISNTFVQDPVFHIMYDNTKNSLNIEDSKGVKELTIKDLNSKIDTVHKKNEAEIESLVDDKFSSFRVDLENFAFSEWSSLIDDIKDEIEYKIRAGEISKEFAAKLENILTQHYDSIEDAIEWRKLARDIKEVVKVVENYEPDYYEEDDDYIPF
jgi:hypothetical protein